jgi:hypothetical protein
VLGAVALQYGYQACAAGLLSLPVWIALSASRISSFPDPDRSLFERGGVYLLEVLREQLSLLSAGAGVGLCLLAGFALAAFLPDWWALAAFSRVGATTDTRRGRRTLVRLALLGALTWSLRAVLWGLALSLAFLARSWLSHATDERSHDLLLVAGVALGLGLQVGASLLHDLTGASVVSNGASLRRAVVHALAAALARGRARRLWAWYLACRLGQLTLLVGSVWLLSALDPGGPAVSGSAHVGLRLLAHQAAIALGSALRVLWLWQAARSLERAPARDHAEAFL